MKYILNSLDIVRGSSKGVITSTHFLRYFLKPSSHPDIPMFLLQEIAPHESSQSTSNITCSKGDWFSSQICPNLVFSLSGKNTSNYSVSKTCNSSYFKFLSLPNYWPSVRILRPKYFPLPPHTPLPSIPS